MISFKERARSILSLFPTAILVLSLVSCLDFFGKDCFDPDDPCPNDMITDELGCKRDQCAGDVFWGERIPCFWNETGESYAWWTLVGEGGRYVAYIQDLTEEDGVEGPIWLYDTETGENSLLTEPERMCTRMRADGDRLVWSEIGEELEYGPNANNVYVMDVVTGQEWQVPNPDRRYIESYSHSGNHVAYVIRSYIPCNGFSSWHTIWLYDTETLEHRIIADSRSDEEEEYRSLNAEIHNGIVVYWRVGGVCNLQRSTELRTYNLTTDDDLLLKEWDYRLPLDTYLWHEFLFDGYWIVFNEDSRFMAHAIDGSRVVEGPICPFGCVFYLSNGMVAYTMYGEDDLIQYQTHVFDLETEQEIQITEMRPYFDSSGPEYFLDGRLLWDESRGAGIGDDCGNYRSADPDFMLFWKDIEF